MTIYATAYDTTAGRGFVMGKTVEAIVDEVVKSNFAMRNAKIVNPDVKETSKAIKATVLSNLSAGETGLPFFAHPLFVSMEKLKGREHEKYMVGDVRLFLGAPGDGGIRVKNASEYDLCVNRTIFNAHWMELGTVGAGVSNLLYFSTTPMAVYVAWMSENIARRFALDGLDQLKIAILSALYYNSLFTNDEYFTDGDLQRMARVIAKVTYARVEQVFEVMDLVKKLTSLEDFCEAVKIVTENTRVQDINHGIVTAIASNTWFGTYGKEIAAVAVDHPPTWFALLLAAFTNRTFHNSNLSRIAERYRANKGEHEFVLGLKTIKKNAFSMGD